MFKRIIVLILIIFAFKGCTKDDICPEDTATTPNLIIVFNDIANPANRKKVEVLTVTTDDENAYEVLKLVSTDTIVIPLNTNSDTTKYVFRKSIIVNTDTTKIDDNVMFIYDRKNGYVSRACGFKTEFDNLREEVTNNWIEDVMVNRNTVNDENSAHVTMLH
ncbi:hypothetical protein Aeqsu_2851 [Aequorivita sublithincola DSM 14238]|uniref:Uncharacterized protein n=1 Tax=Aequorivita sublithincola (strain DSM 14238 / LMG 21431 / ACAM 643 / 9-3) TaxID=746697 RepID=I3YZ80_AEQSU|nr:DUF6452 family protein [Aequorivita sublithincola]AFL82298.1 hypothetical protein Aeqsu_2851 [Aequorivita sublithincola DSM 14238]